MSMGLLHLQTTFLYAFALNWWASCKHALEMGCFRIEPKGRTEGDSLCKVQLRMWKKGGRKEGADEIQLGQNGNWHFPIRLYTAYLEGHVPLTWWASH